MKVKIRGLVFVGFAAAVFAQSAFAAITPNATTDPKTVTSKKYVDEKIPGTYAMTYGGTTHEAETTAGAVVLGNGYGEVKFTKLSNSSADVHTTNGQDVVVTGKAVADAMAVTQNLQAENYTQITDIHADPNDATSAVTGHKVVLDANKIDTTGAAVQSGSTDTNNANLVTAGAIKTSMATSISSSSTNTMLATPKAVYDYAQPMVADDNGTGVYLGKWNETGGVGEWSQLTTSGYVTADTASGYAIGLDGSKITSNNNNGADITAAGETIGTGDTITDAEKEKLTTAKAVYDFVKAENAAYQPKVQDTDAGKLMLGYSTQTGEGAGATFAPGWKELSVATASGATPTLSSTSYVAKTVNGSVYTVNLDNELITTTGTAINGYDATTNNGNGNDLVTVSAIKEYAGGIIDVTNPCSASATDGHYCALVAKYSAGAPNNVEYEWTIMAPQQ